MNGGNNDELLGGVVRFTFAMGDFVAGGAHIVSPTDGLDVAADFIAECRVKAARRLVKEQNLGFCHETACDTQSLLLAATESLFDGCTDNGVLLPMKTEAADEVVNTLQCFLFRHVAGLV